MVIFVESVFLTGNGKPIKKNLIVSLEEVVQIFKLFVLFSCQFLELIFHLFRNFSFINSIFVERQDFFFFCLKTTTQLSGFKNSISKLEVAFQFLDCVS